MRAQELADNIASFLAGVLLTSIFFYIFIA